ncbi:MAG TPA: TonB family protein [Acidobacteriaceae bacterium]|nr:TonB family protein [Acidobacteriaceae bacterium]
MNVRCRLLAGAVLVAVSLAGAAPIASADNPGELQDHLKKAADLSTPIAAGMKPWHMKLAVQLFDLKGVSMGAGSVEEWWMAPGNEKRVFALPDYTGTEIVTSDGIFRSPGLITEPMTLTVILNQMINPMAAEEKAAGFKPMARTLQLAGITLPCVMLAKSNSRVANQPIGFYPSWCTEPGKDALRVFVDDGGMAAVRNGISSFQGKDIATDINLTVNGVVVGTGHLEAISLDDMPSTPYAPDREMVKALPRPVELKGKKLENQAAKRVEPDFSRSATGKDQSTRTRNGALQGDVEIRLWIGEDGQIRDMRLESYPDAGAAQTVFDAVRQWSFHPYMQEGRAVPVTGTLDFEINNTDYDRQIRR